MKNALGGNVSRESLSVEAHSLILPPQYKRLFYTVTLLSVVSSWHVTLITI